MKTLYLECNMGAAGDMLMAALLELNDDQDGFLSRLNGAGIPGVEIIANTSVKCGIQGTRMAVKIHGRDESQAEPAHHDHGSFHDISKLIGNLKLSEKVKKNAFEVYSMIAQAESRAHGMPVKQIHFHELGTMDAVADIVGVCMLVEELAPDRILASPINVGSGHVRCAHGILPVPAPATAEILRNVPIYSGEAEGELCTPTGAALLKHFVRQYCEMPVIVVSKIGYGMGKRDFDKANCIRAFLGNSYSAPQEIVELVCNVDDMTPEALAFAQELLFEEGALDVYAAPVVMKKGRLGTSLTCMCAQESEDRMLALIFKHTSTIGIRAYRCRRYALDRDHKQINTKYGPVRIKTSYGLGTKKTKAEYEDLAGIARDNQMPILEVTKEAEQFFSAD